MSVQPFSSTYQPSVVDAKPRILYGKSKALREAIELQQIMMNDARDPMTSVSDRAAIARSWSILEETKRCLLGRLKPGSINVSQSAPGKKQLKPASSIDVQAVARLMESE